MAVQLAPQKPAYRGLSWDEYRRLPDIALPYEIIQGDLIMSPAPVTMHQIYSQRIFSPMREWVQERDLGYVLYAPVDVLIRRSPLQTRQPDVLFISKARSGVLDVEDLEDMPVVDTPPDLAVEILSSDEKRRHLPGKMADYTQIGILELWLASAEIPSIEVLALEEGAYATVGRFGRGDTVISRVLPGFELHVNSIFPIRKRR